MKIIKKATQIQELIKDLKAQGKAIAFVPTMGFLHEGHLTLVKRAKELADVVVVSIFVNKKQFNNPADFANYPIDIEADLKKLQEKSVDVVFVPTHEEVYPETGAELEIYLEEKMDNILCGKSRPGHFVGVCKVLRRFFDLIKPDFAIFGLKDYQQYVVVRNMVDYFDLPIKIIGVETVREASNLALSSRNHNLGDYHEKAALIHKIMRDAKNQVKKTGNINLILHNSIREIEKNPGFKVDYFEIRRESDLALVKSYDEHVKCRLFAAVYVAKVRLIDNLSI